MQKLYVLYDAECSFCCRCRQWVEGQSAFLEIEFITAKSPEARERFPDMKEFGGTDELTVISDDGAVYRGPNAFIMCLYALVEFREWSLRLSRPALLPFARQLFNIVSKNRVGFSKWLRVHTDEEMARALSKASPPLCGNENMSCLKTAARNALVTR